MPPVAKAGTVGVALDGAHLIGVDPPNQAEWSGVPGFSTQEFYHTSPGDVLPPGVTLAQKAAGTGTTNQWGWKGVPTEVGVWTVTINAAGTFPGGSYTWTISLAGGCPLIDVEPDALGMTFLGLPLYVRFLASNGVPPYTWDVAEWTALPDGLTLSSEGVLGGTPTTAGTYSFTIRATDDNGCPGVRALTLVVGRRILIDGVDVTVEIEEADIELVLSRASSARLIVGDGYLPDRGADVLMYARDGLTPIFGGLIRSRRITGMTPSNPASKGEIEIVDYSVFFDDAVVTLVYTSDVALEDLIVEIVDQSLADYGITYTPVVYGITVPPIEWIEITVTEAFKRISDATTAVFRVLPLKELVVFGPLAFPAPFGIADADDEDFINPFDLEWQDGPTLAPNTVDLLCGPTGNGIATQHWTVAGDTSWEVDIQAVLGAAQTAVASHGFLGTIANFAAGETVTLGSSTYTFRASLVGDVAGEVLIGANAEASLNNLVAAITNAGGSGYAPSTPVNADASAYLRQPDQISANALTPGAAGNAIPVATTAANAAWYGEGGSPTPPSSIDALQLGFDASAAGGWTQGFVLEDGIVSQPVGLPGSGAYYEWDVNAGRGTLSLGSGTAAPDGTVLELKYLAVYPFHARYSTGTPPRTYRETHPEILNYDDGLALALAIYNRESLDRREVEIFTDVDGFFPGQELDIAIDRRGGVIMIGLITNVRIKLVNREIWEYRIAVQQSLGSYQGSFVEQWKKLTSGGGSSAAAPPPLPAGGAIGAGDIYADGRTAFTADQSLGGHKLTHGADPVDAQDFATKAYADSLSGGGMVQIAQIVTSGSQATVDFTSIPGSYSSLRVEFFCRDTQGGTGAVAIRLKINNDGTSGNYSSTVLDGTQAGAALNTTSAATGNGVFVGGSPQDSNTTGMIGTGILEIVGYAGTTFHKRVMFDAAYEGTAGGLLLATFNGSAAWKSTSAINRLTFGTDGTAFKNGSVFTLYGIQ